MRPSCFPPLLAAWFLILSGIAARGLTLATLGPGAGSAVTSLAVVDGRPAVAWLDTTAQMVKYVRALDADGAAWGTPVAVTPASGGSGLMPWLHLRVVNGRPAVCFATSPGLHYMRALDAAGAAWPSTRVTLATGYAIKADLDVINGTPAVAARIPDAPYYLRALDADGTAWAAPAAVNSLPLSSGDLDLAEVDGRPAVISANSTVFSNAGLRYVRALDADGTTWSSVVGLPVPTAPGACALQMVDGRPAAACFTLDQTFARFQYLRALTPDGVSWDPVVIHTSGIQSGIGQNGQLSLGMVNGKPAMTFAAPGGTLFFSRATDSTGSAWREAGPLDSSGNTRTPSLQEVNGAPAVAYVDIASAEVRYLRASLGGGPSGFQWAPELTVLVNQSVVRSGFGFTFRNTAAGSTDTLTLVLRNTNQDAADLHITGLTLTGADVAEFKILTPPQSPLPGGSETHMVVAYAPQTPGEKFAELRIASDTGTGTTPFRVPLAGFTRPEIFVDRPGGREVPPGGIVELPATPAGAQADIGFLVRNTGAAELQVQDVTFVSGPPAGEFSIVQPLPAVLAPGQSAPLVIRHAPSTGGSKFGTCTLFSNAPPPRNQYAFNVRLMSGSVDESFEPGGDGFLCVALEPGGRILAGGFDFIAAFRPDGTPDTSFFAPVIEGAVLCLAVQRDGGILAGGGFERVGGFYRPDLVRLLPNGTIDDSFGVDVPGPVHALAILPDDKIIAGGERLPSWPQALPSPVRLMPDGTLDLTFQCFLADKVLGLAVQPDGRVLACGMSLQGTPAHLFNEDGSEVPFPLQIFGPLTSVARRPDGVLTGAFWDGGIVRVDAAGAPAPGYVPTLRNLGVTTLALQADGACLAGGSLVEAAGFQRVVGRVRPDGRDDAGFFAMSDKTVRCIALQEDGKPVIAGTFLRINNESVLRPGLVRLNSEPSLSVLSRAGNTAVRWMRGGTAPEVSDVSFEINTPGGGGDAWVLLGFGTRVDGGWELTGLNLPDTCRIRARGRAGGSLTQTVESFPPPLEAWRLQHFGTTENTGDAADSADPDKDGLANFAEFAFGLNPVDGGSIATPPFILTRGAFTATFTAPEGRDARVLYRAAWSPSMQPGTWTPIFDTGLPPAHEFSAPATGTRVFVRWEVSPR